MKSRKVLLAVTTISALSITGCETLKLPSDLYKILETKKELGVNTIIAGLKEALIKGSEEASNQLSKKGGYTNNKLLHIPVPEEFKKVSKTMRQIGLGSLVDDFECKMNAGAEQAAGQIKPIFGKAIQEMSFNDARQILNGNNTAATDYFRRTIGKNLRQLYAPVVQKQLNSVGAIRAYNDLLSQYSTIPFVKQPKLNLEEYVVDKAINGLFDVIAQKEQWIREDPAARTTEILRRVFE